MQPSYAGAYPPQQGQPPQLQSPTQFRPAPSALPAPLQGQTQTFGQPPPQQQQPPQMRNFAPPPAGGFQSPPQNGAPGAFFAAPPMGAPAAFQAPPPLQQQQQPGANGLAAQQRPPQAMPMSSPPNMQQQSPARMQQPLTQQFGQMSMGGAPSPAAAAAAAPFNPAALSRPPTFAPPTGMGAAALAPSPASASVPAAAPGQFAVPPPLPNRFAQPPPMAASPQQQQQQPQQPQTNGFGGPAPANRPPVFGAAPPPQFGMPPQQMQQPQQPQQAQQAQQQPGFPAPGAPGPVAAQPPAASSQLPSRFPAPPPVSVPPPNLAAMQAQREQVVFNNVPPVRPFDDQSKSPLQQPPHLANGGAFQQQHMQPQQQQPGFGSPQGFAIPPSSAVPPPPMHQQQPQQTNGAYASYNQAPPQQQPQQQQQQQYQQQQQQYAPPPQQQMYGQQQQQQQMPQQQQQYADPNQQGQYGGNAYNPVQSPMASPGGTQKPKRVDRIDPKQIPRRQEFSAAGVGAVKYHTRSMTLPPAATADFVCIDEGNCSPRFVRLTTNNIAHEQELIDSTKLCIGAIIQPLANLGDGEEPVPIVHYPNGPLRCGKCFAYVNPFFRFIESGNAFECNLCGMRNDVPDEYRCNLDANGYRRDRHERAELCRGSVEFEVGADFQLRPKTDPVFLFVLDVSYGAVVSGLVGASISAVRSAIDQMGVMLTPDGQPNRYKVGVITYDSAVHFYSLKPGLRTEPMMLVMPDVDEPFMPCPPEEICVHVAVEENRALLHSTLDMLAAVYERDKVTENLPAFGAAVSAAADTLAALGGGKMLVTQSNLPQVGVGKLEHRDQISLYLTEKEKTLQVPQSSYYQVLATRCAEAAITVDLFVCANGYVDLATVGALCEKTGGQVFQYPGFNAQKDGLALQRDVYHDVTRVTGYDGIMIVRCSTGLKVAEHFGNYYHRKVEELELASVSADATFGVRIEHAAKLKDKSDACIQCALLYTSASGHRRIRVHTISVPVTSVMSNIFRFADLDAIVNLSLKQAVRQLLDSTSCADAQNALTMACIESLYVYRKFCASATSAGQLILPEPLKLLPLCTLGLVKHPLFQDGLAADERSFLFAFVNSMPCYVSVAFVCPRLFNLTSFDGSACVPDETGRVHLPVPLTLSSESVSPGGLYLLDDGRYMYLYIGNELPAPFLEEVFAIKGDGRSQAGQYRIRHVPNQPESISSRINVLIGTLRKNKPAHQVLQIISRRSPATQPHTPAQNGGGVGRPSPSPTNRAGWETFESLDESLFFSHLIEDAVHKPAADAKNPKDKAMVARAPNTMSYIDFLCFIHKRIQSKFL